MERSVAVLVSVSTLLAAVAALITVRQASGEQQLTRDGQVTDRYTAAVTNLGATSEEVRIGGLYALERIAEDSPRDVPSVVQVMAAYVRSHTVLAKKSPKELKHPANDVAAALFCLTAPLGTVVVDLHGSVLRGADLRGGTLHLADLTDANLTDANLTSADLTNANLSRANLTRANLHDADLSTALLDGANLTETDLSGANLTRASLAATTLTGLDLSSMDLSHADLRSAKLSNMDLSHADLTGVDLTAATLTDVDLTGAKMTDAVFFETTLQHVTGYTPPGPRSTDSGER
ncbi:pentapeptide repeat-containing protein (plasmid) [Streptomyces sp. NBC_01281]|uniref:pentapeptide repeat-containing protein n=1 Tax=Streptomyces sp. NBC_01281 TaxID=2903811 RepID=UPI002E10292A|nr:pentapeptide repeat-containing protein [Streptomyces sp. NBC_01281]